MERINYKLEYSLAAPRHPIKILLVGVGGTGSQVLNCLGRISYALRKTGHPGFHVKAMDGDVIEEFNVGRQLFSASEIGYNKAVSAVSKINRFFGTSWEASAEKITDSFFEDRNHGETNPNLIISCVDNVEARRIISRKKVHERATREFHTYYWMDFGNTQQTGQAILGTISPTKFLHSQKQADSIPHVLRLYPKMEKFEKKNLQGPSCSMAEALGKQDLFINSMLAQAGCNILWKLFYHKKISDHGVFLNLSTMNLAPLAIKPIS